MAHCASEESDLGERESRDSGDSARQHSQRRVAQFTAQQAQFCRALEEGRFGRMRRAGDRWRQGSEQSAGQRAGDRAHTTEKSTEREAGGRVVGKEADRKSVV